ncbi:glycosyl hydrolase 53 family protein [Streptomyces capparidis]
MPTPRRLALRTTLTAALLTLAAATLAPAPHAAAAATLANAGFESGAQAVPASWSESGDVNASFTESGGRSGSHRLTHWASGAYRTETHQTLDGLSGGWYTLTAWVRSSGGQKSAHIALRDCGAAEQRTDLPVTPSDGAWLRLVTSVQVTGGRCTVVFSSDANAGNWANFDDVRFTPGRTAVAAKGVDVSTLKKSEDRGGVHRTADGTQADALQILTSHGANYGRLKVWVNPADGYNNKTQVLAMAKRIKDRGMKLLVDFHYSDTWADPGKQYKPAAWASHGYSQLRTDVHNHTHDVLSALKNQGTTADMVQIGNEINGGMLWPEGSTDNWSQLAGLLTSGANAAKAVSPSTKVALHLAEGGDNAATRWWFDQAVQRNVPFDVIGLSFYGFWHGTLSELQANLDDVAARYGKDVFVAETAYVHRLDSEDGTENIINLNSELIPGYPATPAGQAAWLRDVMSVVEAVPNGRGLGVFYWEPTWTAVRGNGWDPADPSSGNGWENQALFGYDDRALPALRWLGHR